MSKIKLTYFDIAGGRGELARLTLSLAGIEFEDERISFREFAARRQGYPFRAVPVLETEGGLYTQSNAMSRYFGRQAGLYPEDPWQAFLCDEILEVIEDAMHLTGRTFFLKDEALQKARQELVADRFIPYLGSLSERLSEAGGVYFCNQSLTLADLKVFLWVRSLTAGILDHVPTTLVNEYAPDLARHCARIAAEPGVKAYYES